MPSTFGHRLRELRLAKDLTQRELAKKAGIDFTYLSKIENDQPGYQPSEQVIRELAKLLGTDAEELVLLAQKIPEKIQRAMARNIKAHAFLRSAADLSEADWDKILKIVEENKKRGARRCLTCHRERERIRKQRRSAC
jgi:transcriptional regulator with XRE-family HTH domain